MSGAGDIAAQRWEQGDDCTVVVEGAGTCVAVLGDPNDGATAEDWARLPLIIAAPELLHAAEALLVPLSAALEDGCRVDPSEMVATMRMARQAIAKARGRRPMADNPLDGRGGGRPG